MKKETKKADKANKGNIEKPALKGWLNRKRFFEGLIFAFAFLLFANTISNNYNMDDELVTMKHRLTAKGISAIPEIFTSPYYQDESGYSYEYRPVVLTTFAIENQFFGDNPHVSHFWNIILYGLSCVLLYRVLLLILGVNTEFLALAMALLFVAYPVHTEVVCSIKNRDEILGLLFSLMSLLCAIKAIQTKKLLSLILVPILFTFALLSKLTFLSFVFIIPLTLLLFFTFDYKRLLFIVVSLLLPFLFISGFGNTITKVFVVLAATMAVSLFYLLLHHKLVIAFAKEKWALVFKSENFVQVQTQPSDTISDSFLDKMMPPFSMLTLREYLFGFGLVVLYVLGFYFHLIVLRLIVFVCLLLFFFWKKGERSWFVTMLMLAVIVAGSYNFYFSHYPFVVDFFLLPIIYQLLFGKRIFIVPSAVAIVAIMAISVLATHDYLNVLTPLPLILVLFGMRYKFGWVLALLYFIGNIVPILTAGISGISSHTINTGSDILNLIAFTILAYTIAKKRDANFVSKIVLLIAFAVSVLFFPAPEPPTHVVANAVTVTRSINTSGSGKTENRPINFVENCIDYVNTPQAVKLGTSFEILGHYLGKTIIPYPLSYYYGYSFIRPMSITDTLPATSLVLHLLLLLLAFYFLRKDKRLSYGIFIYLLAVATFSNYLQPVPGMIGDRFLLIPSLGWVILLVVVLQNVFRVKALHKEAFLQALSPMAKYIFLAVLSVYTVLTFARNRDWNDWFSLFRHDIKYVDSSAQAHNLLALRLMKDSYNGHTQQEQLAMYQEALIHFKRAVEIYPQFFNATYDVARVYTMLNVMDSALIYYNRASELNPTFSEGYNAAGEILFQKNQFSEARAKFEKIITIFPNQYVGYEKVSYVYFMEKEYAKSLEVNKLALQKVTANPQPYIAIAKTFHAMNQDDSTRYYLKKALDISPSHPEATSLLNNLPH